MREDGPETPRDFYRNLRQKERECSSAIKDFRRDTHRRFKDEFARLKQKEIDFVTYLRICTDIATDAEAAADRLIAQLDGEVRSLSDSAADVTPDEKDRREKMLQLAILRNESEAKSVLAYRVGRNDVSKSVLETIGERIAEMHPQGTPLPEDVVASSSDLQRRFDRISGRVAELDQEIGRLTAEIDAAH